MSSVYRYRIAGMIGNILEHYDNALFGLLAPFIAPLFFNKCDPLTALILTYAILPLGIITRPLGSLFFGWVGDRFGRKNALYYSLLGVAAVTVAIGCLPTWQQAGILSPILLAFCQMVQKFCAAGESSGGAIFVLEHTASSKRSFVSSLYDASSILGILIASALVAFFCWLGIIKEGWRILFWIGSITAILGLFLRTRTEEGQEYIQSPREKKSPFKVLKENQKALFAVILASGFSYTTYALAFTLMNGYVPMVTSHSATDVMVINTALLMLDMLLLPCFGYLSQKWGKEKVMGTAAFCSSIAAIPLFFLLDDASLQSIIAVRIAIVMLGVAFAASYHAWALELVDPQHRYTILSVGCALGSQLIGAPSSAICLWLYKQVGWVCAPGIYLLLVGAAAGFVVWAPKKQPQFKYK